MVPGLSGTKSRASKGSSTVSRSVEAKLKRSVSSSSSCSKATRLATVAKGIEASGFSKEVAQRVALGGLRCSSLKVYDSRWNIFAKWCKSKGISPWEVSIQQIADFLLSLFKEGSLKVSTIEGYKSDNSGLEVGKDPHLCALVNGFYTERPVQRTVLPKWDLVPSALTKAPFEYSNFGSVELKFFTFKTYFS